MRAAIVALESSYLSEATGKFIILVCGREHLRCCSILVPAQRLTIHRAMARM